MKNFLFQLSINYKRIILRNLRFLVFSILMPIGFYLLFTQVMTQGIPADALQTWNADYLISMMVYSSLISSIITVSNTLLEDHMRKFDLYITLSPISKIHYYLSMMIVFLSLNLLSAVSLVIVACFINHVIIHVFYLILICLIVPLLSLPLLLIGIIVSLVGSGNVVNLVSNLLVFPMAILSGLWWPLDIMPDWVQKISVFLPTFHSAKLLKEIIHQHHIHLLHLGVILLWIIILAIIIKVLTTVGKKGELQTI
ncbi:ABC transporter permease [Enterococcus durans]|uniref:ABC transporter permease n=1 Tax=Enterococcus durans TaxID=53345 RepID=UPI00187E46EA|nr:ABC transporter permease [Enterococcus durans]MBE8848250.1 ABC transporter permease [Enterococcus durans]MDB1653779.1 ABC transporter permease [Enterococcus durans]MDB1654866.1 ABC transporter permease [Enterococcus durans]MDB1663937.1 ABC transporter permease [Enterococcus durans]MDB1669533.1 ABC transporter permease [Enterococcus durans]